MFWTGTVLDACWHLTDAVALDPAEHEQLRRRQILQLARYGRFGGGDIHQWDREPVGELLGWYAALKDLLDGEHALQASAENG